MKASLASTLCGLMVCLAVTTSSARADGPFGGSAGTVAASDGGGFGSYYQPPPGLIDGLDGGVVISDFGGMQYAPFGPQVFFESSLGDGIGYDNSSYVVRAFLPKHVQPGQSLVFASLGGSVTEDGQFVGNFGGAYRVLFPRLGRILTVDAFYDIDDGHENTFQRSSVGVEWVGKYVDLRANAYYILGSENEFLLESFVGQPFFRAHRVFIGRARVFENAYNSYDVEVGGRLPFLGDYGLSAYVGGYHVYSEEDTDATGVRARVRQEINDDVTFDVMWSNDRVFGVNTWFNLTVLLPDGRPRRWFKQRPLKERLADAIVRENRIPTHIDARGSIEPLINPADGEAFRVNHVNPNQGGAGALLAGGGDGSIESPFISMEDARLANNPDVDIIRVLPRVDNTGTNLQIGEAFQLFDNQRLLGASEQHFVTAVQGTVILPGQVVGTRPLISNLNQVTDSLVLLANGNEVSGFIFDGGMVPGGIRLHNGISGTNSVGFNINRNTIQNGLNGINLVTTGGGATAGVITDNTILMNSNAGILLTADSGTSNLTITDNTIAGNGGTQIDTQLTGTAVATLDVENNDIFAGGLLVGDAGLGLPPNINITQLPGNQDESAIAINPVNNQQLFASANNTSTGQGIFAARSIDGGQTWLPVFGNDFAIADGTDGLPVACCDPSVAWDDFGNLFVVYLTDTGTNQVAILNSTDGGATMNFLGLLGPTTGNDQPTVTTGPGLGGLQGSVWVTYDNGVANIVAQGAPVTGLGLIGGFGNVQNTAVGQFGDISIGPLGQVVVTGQGQNNITVATDIDGLGAGGFAAPVTATGTNVDPLDLIAAQNGSFGIDAEAGLAYDRSGGVNNGRLYLVYTDEDPNESDDTNIFIRISDNDGTTWSAPIRVNDDATGHSQFLPQVEVDQTTGVVAVTFHDGRNDIGIGPNDSSGIPNDEAQFFGAISRNGGLSFETNVQIAVGTSNSNVAPDNPFGIRRLDFGDYTGLTFHNGAFFPTWSDNSNSTGNNPNGTLSAFDVYTARVTVLFPGVDGIGVLLADDAVLQNSTFANNRIDGVGQFGINVSAIGNAQVNNLTIQNNTITNAGLSGIFFDAAGNSVITDSLVDGNTSNNNGLDGLTATAREQGRITRLLVTNNTFSNNSFSGVFLERLDDGLFGDPGFPNTIGTGIIVGTSLADGNEMTFNTVAGLEIQGSGNAPAQRSVVDHFGNVLFGNGTNIIENIVPNAEFLINGVNVP